MKNELGPYRTSANLEVRKPTLRERFREWRRVRRLRTCNGCLEKVDKDEVVYELPMFMYFPDEGFKGSIKPGDFAYPETYAFCPPCKRENKKQWQKARHDRKVKEKAYELQVEREAYEKVKRKFEALDEERLTKV